METASTDVKRKLCESQNSVNPQNPSNCRFLLGNHLESLPIFLHAYLDSSSYGNSYNLASVAYGMQIQTSVVALADGRDVINGVERFGIKKKRASRLKLTSVEKMQQLQFLVETISMQ